MLEGGEDTGSPLAAQGLVWVVSGVSLQGGGPPFSASLESGPGTNAPWKGGREGRPLPSSAK